MRLTCPNCDAQYEVPDEVIPTAGRDVQCSNCGKTWFQHHADHMPQADVEDVAAPDPDEEVATPPPAPSAPASAPPSAPVRQELDAGVADILREEAETERAARRQDSGGLESQPDLGLGDDEAPRGTAARDRMARMRGKDPAVSDEAATAAAVGSRRDLLPDIEEINSTLRTSSDRGAPTDDTHAEIEAPTEKRKRRGFRTGFVVMLLLLVIALLIYIFAPDLSRMVPALDSVLNSYVAWVDQMRLWLDGQVKSLLAWLDSVANQSSGDAVSAEPTGETAPSE